MAFRRRFKARRGRGRRVFSRRRRRGSAGRRRTRSPRVGFRL